MSINDSAYLAGVFALTVSKLTPLFYIIPMSLSSCPFFLSFSSIMFFLLVRSILEDFRFLVGILLGCDSVTKYRVTEVALET